MRDHANQRRTPARRGLSLLEVVLSMAITGGLLASVFTAVGVSAQRGYSSQQRARAAWLAHDLLAEIGAKPCAADADNVLTLTPIDLDAVTLLKSATQGSSRAAYDSLYDYANWMSSPPVDASGNALSGFEGWIRAVTVCPVDPTNFSKRTTDDASALITVAVLGPNGATASAVALRSYKTDELRGVASEDAVDAAREKATERAKD